MDRANGAFRTARATPAGPGLRAFAVDGEAPRGSRTHVTGHITLLTAMNHIGHVLAQRQVADKSNEIPSPAGSRATGRFPADAPGARGQEHPRPSARLFLARR
ncbi:hypothetical protein [Streptomyces sp. NPDC002324]